MRRVDFVGSVIRGTLREEDLIPVFTEILEKYAPRKARLLRREYADIYGIIATGEDIPRDWETRETVNALMEELFDTLNEIAPPGCYFGSHPGDGSDFGFWPLDFDLLEERLQKVK